MSPGLFPDSCSSTRSDKIPTFFPGSIALTSVSSLPERENKIVIIISDGIFNPPENSRYAGMSPADAQTELSSLARRIRSAGWEVYYIKLPFPENAVIRSLDDTILADTSAGHPDGETREYLDVSSEFTEQMDIRPSEFIGEDVPVDFVDSVFSLPEVEFRGTSRTDRCCS